MHLDENDIARYVDGWVSEGEREQMEAHLAECVQCRGQVTATYRLVGEEDDWDLSGLDFSVQQQAESLRSDKQSQSRTPQRWDVPVLVGVLAVLLGIAGILFWQYQGTESDRLRSSVEREAFTVRAPADGAEISQRPVFVCDTVDAAFAYRVTLYAPDGAVLWEGDTTSARVSLPTEVSLTDGQTYLWRAAALRSDGTMDRSGLRSFTYTPETPGK